MYKETLDILMEDINDPFKETILKNQLKYHFLNKTPENKDAIDCSTVIVRRILSNFNVGKIIGIQPVIDDKTKIISDGVEYDIKIDTRPFQTCKPEISYKDLETINGIDLEAEINQAIAAEIAIEITSELLKTISDNIKNNLIIDASFTNIKNIKDVVNAIKNEMKEVDANWIVVSPAVLAILQSDSKSRYKTGDEQQGTMDSLSQVGWLDDVAVYCSLWTDDTILIGSKDPNSEDTAIIYAPKTMMIVGDKESSCGEDRTPLLTSGATFVNLEAVKRDYRKISINFDN